MPRGRAKRKTSKDFINEAVERTEASFIKALQEVMPGLVEQILQEQEMRRENQVHMLDTSRALKPSDLGLDVPETEDGFGYSTAAAPEPDDPWAHRHIGMRCRTCMFFVVKSGPSEPGRQKGRCRRRAPSMNGYPVVFENDWCGDHKLA